MDLTGSSTAESHERSGPDFASERLIAELLLSDIASVQATQKGKAREDAPRSDEDIALDLQAASLRASIGVLHDRQFASSIDQAIASDARQLRRLAVLEQGAYDDRRAAVALGAGHDLPLQTPSQRATEQTLAQPAREHRTRHGHASDTMETINARMENIHIATPEASKTGHRQSSKNLDMRVGCVICGDIIVASRLFKAPCAHHYCRGCIVSLVESSLRDEGLYPLRCCNQHLPLESNVFKFISASLRLQFLTKSWEYSVPVGSRVYCSNPRCSTFLGASGDMKRNLTCGGCGTASCSQCKNNAHPGENCSENQLTLELQETATANKWQTCPGCHAIVELSQGCYHITCRCSAQFCYLCAARWKTCRCEQWNEDLLLNDADRRIRNEFGDRAAEAEPTVHAERLYQRMEQLRDNHECRAHFWRYRHGAGECEECGDFLRVFLMRCSRCQALVCRRCSVNRL